MLRWLRGRACCLIAAVLLAVGTTTTAVAELLHAGTDHDVACVSLREANHDASNHRFKAPASDVSTEDHCVGCHLARAPRVGPQSVSKLGQLEEVSSSRPIAAIGSARAVALGTLPSRAPPRFS